VRIAFPREVTTAADSRTVLIECWLRRVLGTRALTPAPFAQRPHAATASRTFTYSPTLRLLTALRLVALLALVGAALAWDERVSTRDAILIWSGLALAASWLYLELHATG